MNKDIAMCDVCDEHLANGIGYLTVTYHEKAREQEMTKVHVECFTDKTEAKFTPPGWSDR